MSNFVPNQSIDPKNSNKKISFNRFKGFAGKNTIAKNINQNIKYHETLYKKDSFDVLEKSIRKDSSATTLHNTVKRGSSMINLCKQNINTIFNTGSSLNFPKGNDDCSLSHITDLFYTLNENVIFYLTIDAAARQEMVKFPAGSPNLDLNALNTDTNYGPVPVGSDWYPGWKLAYKSMNLILQYNKKIYPVSQIQGRIKGTSSFRPYNKKMALRLKTLNNSILQGLETITDLSLNNMVGDPSKLTEYIIYNKVFREYGAIAPRANYCRLFINDTTMTITSLTNNTITTASNHYLKNGYKIKFANDLNTTFYVINSNVLNNTFKVSLNLNGPEFDLSDLGYAPSQFYFDHGEYINIELIQNEYTISELFGKNNTKHLYELDPANLGYEIDYGNNDTSDLINYLDKTSPTHPDFYNRLLSVIDIDNYIRHAVIESYCGQSDGFYFNNINVHLHSDKNGIFRLIPWGSDSYFTTPDLLLYQKIPLELWGSETTIKLFVKELLKFHNWISQSNITSSIESIFTQKINAFVEEKNTDNNPIRSTLSFLTDQKNNMLSFLSSRSEIVDKFLQRPYPVSNLTVTRDSGQLIISFDPVTKNLKDENIILGLNGNSAAAYTINIVESGTGETFTFSVAQSTSRITSTIDLAFIGVIQYDSDENNLNDLTITVTPIADPISFGVAPFSIPQNYSPGFISAPAVLKGTIDDTPQLPLVRVTEVMSSINTGPSQTRKDWFEVTNFDTSSVSITNWKIDDGSAQVAASTNLIPFGSWNSILPNESIVCIETSSPNIDIPAFSGLWQTNSSTKFASYSGPDISLSSNGDGVTIFDNDIEITKVNFSQAIPNRSFYWRYDNNGNVTATGINSVGIYGAYAASGQIASPGVY